VNNLHMELAYSGRGILYSHSTAHVFDIAQANGAILIIVGDRDSRVTDVLLGSVAHKIAHLADCPVLLVR